MLWFSGEQIAAIPLGALFVAMYVFANLASPGKNLLIATYAAMASIVFSFSPAYNYLISTSENSIIFFVYFSIYAIAAVLMALSTPARKKLAFAHCIPAMACFIMALFEFISYETFYNGLKYKGFENILYDYYEVIVTLLHVVVIAAVVRWSELRSFAGRFCNLVSRLFLDCHSALLNRG